MKYGIICGLGWILFGCNPQPVDQSLKEPSLPDTVTFAEHIAPIIHINCTPCHRPQSAGPFSLITYKDVAKRAKMVAHVTRTRYMPPWPADPDYRHFLGEKILDQHDIDLIVKWHKQGVQEGDPEKTLLPQASQQVHK